MPMEWETVRTTAAQYFGFDQLVRGFGPNDILNLSTDSQALYVGPMDWSWGTDEHIASQLENVRRAYELRCNQVEILMREAAMLIERALGDVLKYDELNLERFKVMIEFLEYDKTHRQELLEQSDDGYWIGLVAEADWAKQARDWASTKSGDITAAYTNAANSYRNAMSAAQTAGSDVARQDAAAGLSTTSAAQMQYSAQVSANQYDSKSRGARQQYESQSRLHQISRRGITQEIVGIKLNELRRPGGALNYNERMQAVGERAFNDF